MRKRDKVKVIERRKLRERKRERREKKIERESTKGERECTGRRGVESEMRGSQTLE